MNFTFQKVKMPQKRSSNFNGFMQMVYLLLYFRLVCFSLPLRVEKLGLGGMVQVSEVIFTQYPVEYSDISSPFN